MRRFIIEHEVEESDLKKKLREEMIAKLASEWNQIDSEMERLSWRDSSERDEEAEFHANMADNFADNKLMIALKANPNLSADEQDKVWKEAEAEYYAIQHQKDSEIILKKEAIEELLSELGARMARPYEHWNEMESYMEWSENRYDSEYRDW